MRDDPTIAALLARSNRLGADKRVTNFAGGNTSAKVTLADPITGAPTQVLAVKGSGGDLGTMTARRARVPRSRPSPRPRGGSCSRGPRGRHRRLLRVLPVRPRGCRAVDRHSAARLHHPGPRRPPAPRLDDRPRRCRRQRGARRRVLRRRGRLAVRGSGLASSSASRCATSKRRSPDARGAVLEGHGMICWADTSEECEALSLDLIARAERFLAERDLDGAFGAVRDGYTALRRRRTAPTGRRLWPRSCAASPHQSVRWSAPSATLRVVLDFLSREAAPRLAAQGTSCPDHFLRTKVRPLLPRPAGDGDARRATGPPRASCTSSTAPTTGRTTTPTPTRPRRRCAVPIR